MFYQILRSLADKMTRTLLEYRPSATNAFAALLVADAITSANTNIVYEALMSMPSARARSRAMVLALDFSGYHTQRAKGTVSRGRMPWRWKSEARAQAVSN